MRTKRGKLLRKTAIPRAWIHGAALLHSTMDIRHWRRANHATNARTRPRRHPSGGLRRLMPWERKERGVSVRVFIRAILGGTQSDVPKNWIVLRDPTVRTNPGTGSCEDWTTWTCENTSGMLQTWRLPSAPAPARD